jgi:hypothetical protein
MKRVHANRLLKLAELLEKLPRKRFDFAHWAGPDWKGAADLSCGTKACALGWATTLPSIRRLGIRLELVPYRSGRNVTTVVCPFGGPYQAGELAFGLSAADFECLFTPWGNGLGRPTPKQVAKHIRKFVAKRMAP